MQGATFVGADLGDGVHVERIDTSLDHYSDQVRVQVELVVTRRTTDLDRVMEKLRRLFDVDGDVLGGLPSAQNETNGTAPPDDEAQEEMREMIERRFDEIDQALRLLVDP